MTLMKQPETIHVTDIAKVLNIPAEKVAGCMRTHGIQGSRGNYSRAAVMTLSSLFRVRGWALTPGDREKAGDR